MKLLTVLAGILALGYGLECKDSSVPSWPQAYSVLGEISIPYTELHEPFHAWYDSSKGSSRIDYYSGTAKTFQFANWPTNAGTNLKIIPITTDTQKNKISCVKTDGSAPGEVQPQPILPDMKDFECAGSGVIKGIKAQKWVKSVQTGEKTSKYIMWVQWNKHENTGEQIPIPVYYEMLGYNSLLGSHYDHYYITYHSYDPNAPKDLIWELPKKFKCTGFPGPGVQSVATFNPMKEFIHGYDEHIDHAWNEFKQTHDKQYDDDADHAFRRFVFMQNHRFIQSHNRAGHGYSLALNHLADRTEDELRSLRGLKKTSGTSNGGSPFPYSEAEMNQALPVNYDWRLYGAVNRVKDQSICGSCWSFGTTGTIEGAYFVKTGKLISLSEQALIDCSWGYGNNGCDGGEDFRSYQWIMKHGGLPLEDEYGPYLAMDGRCHANAVKLHAPITGWVNVTTNDEQALKLAIFKHGPVSIAINASLRTFSFYSNGVYYDPQCKGTPDDLDHAVLAVGYGVLKGQKYWLVKNSWSNWWGNDGYILMAIKNNNCGVMTSPTYVTM